MTEKDFAKLATKADLNKFATKTDLEKFATKVDLERFATKADLEQFAKKSDLEKFTTKDDLEKFATKTDLERLKSDVGVLKEDMVQVKSDIGVLKTAVGNQALKLLEHDRQFGKISEEMREHKSDILNAIDGAVKTFQDTVHTLAIDRMTFQRHGEILENHESRLKKLEPASAS